jgi:serine/threonine-protein kinase
LGLPVGSRLGAYDVVSLLGEGGMGQVYRARDAKLNRDVALKILPEAFTLDGDRIARFRREAQMLAALNHPNIAAIYGFEDSGSTHALVLELVEGPTLADRIAKGRIPLDEALSIAKQIAEALEAAHEQGIIHRDLKPANIKLRDDGTVKVLDFGLAKAMEPASAIGPALTASPTITTPAQMTGVGMILGSAAYMSPEQAKGRAADKRSDVWAFGCVLYEMLTGKRAFEGEDVSDTLAAVLRTEPDWTGLGSSIPSAIRTLVERCLAKDRRRRVGDMSVALFVVAESGAITASSSDRSGRAQVRTSRGRTAITAAAAAVVAAAIVAGGAWSLRPISLAAPVARFIITLPEGQTLGQAARPALAVSRDGTAIAYMTGNRTFLRSLPEFEAHLIPGAEAGAGLVMNTPVFSPDGRSLAFYAAGEGVIKRVSVGGGAAITVCPVEAVFGMTWDVSGVVFGQSRKGIFRCSSTGSSPEQLVKVKDDETPYRPQILPGGAAVLYTVSKVQDTPSQWDKAQVVVETLPSHQRKVIINGGADARYLPTGHLLYALNGVVFAVVFDPVRQMSRGGSVPVIEGVRRAPIGTGAAFFETSDTGTLTYLSGPVGTPRDEWAIATADRMAPPMKMPIAPGPYAHVRASRDGARLAIGSDDGKEAIVWIYDLAAGSAIRRLTFGGHNRYPIWSPDGSRVAFQSDREGDPAIFVQRTDGTGVVERVTKAGQGEAQVPESWSPDGRVIAFSSLKDAAYSLWTVSLADKKTSRFADVRSAEPIGAVFSPDGKWIAYASAPPGVARSPERGIFVQTFPATAARYQIPSQILDFHPVWGPKGTELLYIPSAASGQLSAVSFATQPIVAFGTPVSIPARVTGSRPSGAMRAWDVLADGRFVGLVAPTQSETSSVPMQQIRMVLNWFTELQQRVPTR